MHGSECLLTPSIGAWPGVLRWTEWMPTPEPWHGAPCAWHAIAIDCLGPERATRSKARRCARAPVKGTWNKLVHSSHFGDLKLRLTMYPFLRKMNQPKHWVTLERLTLGQMSLRLPRDLYMLPPSGKHASQLLSAPAMPHDSNRFLAHYSRLLACSLHRTNKYIQRRHPSCSDRLAELRAAMVAALRKTCRKACQNRTRHA